MLKKIFLLLIFSSQLAGICLAQDELENDGSMPNYDHKFSFGFNLGRGFALGDYGNASGSALPLSNFNHQDTGRLNGYAKTGFHYEVFASFDFLSHIGIILQVSADKSSYDMNTLNFQYAGLYPSSNVSFYANSEYYVTQFLAGPKFKLPLSDYCSVELKLLAGYTTVSSPVLTFYEAKDTVSYSYPSGTGFGYKIEAGIKYVTGEGHVGLHFNCGYAGSLITYPNYTYYSSSAGKPVNITYNVPKTMSVGLLQVTFGISFEAW